MITGWLLFESCFPCLQYLLPFDSRISKILETVRLSLILIDLSKANANKMHHNPDNKWFTYQLERLYFISLQPWFLPLNTETFQTTLYKHKALYLVPMLLMALNDGCFCDLYITATWNLNTRKFIEHLWFLWWFALNSTLSRNELNLFNFLTTLNMFLSKPWGKVTV